MSYIVIPDNIFFNKNLSDKAKMLYGLIKRYIDIGECFATTAHFAEKLNFSKRSVERCLKELYDNNLVVSKIEKEGKEIVKRVLSLPSSIEIFNKSRDIDTAKYDGTPTDTDGGTLPTQMAEVITETNKQNNNKKINKKENFAKQVKDQWNKAIINHKIKNKSVGLGVTRTDINNIQRIIEYAKDEQSQFDYTKIEAWVNYFSELFRITKNKRFLQKCILSFNWAVKPDTYSKLANDTYYNLDEIL